MPNLHVNNPTDSARRTRDAEEQLDLMVRIEREIKALVDMWTQPAHGERSPKKAKIGSSRGTTSRE